MIKVQVSKLLTTNAWRLALIDGEEECFDDFCTYCRREIPPIVFTLN